MADLLLGVNPMCTIWHAVRVLLPIAVMSMSTVKHIIINYSSKHHMHSYKLVNNSHFLPLMRGISTAREHAGITVGMYHVVLVSRGSNAPVLSHDMVWPVNINIK